MSPSRSTERCTHNYWWWGDPYPGQPIDELQGVTDAEGRWTVSVPTSSDQESDGRYRFLAEVTDAAGQPISGEHSLPLYWNTFKLDLRTDKYGFEVDEPVEIQVKRSATR